MQGSTEAYKIWKQRPMELELQRRDGSSYKPLPELMEQARDFISTLLERHPATGNGHGAGGGPQRHPALPNAGVAGGTRPRLPASPRRQHLPFGLQHPARRQRPPGADRMPEQHHTPATAAGEGQKRQADFGTPRRNRLEQSRALPGQIDIPLNENGRRQAAAARDFLKDIPIDRAWSSTLSRPTETAQIILEAHPDVPLTQIDGLVEIGHGVWEGKLESEIREDWSELLDTWKQAPETVQMPEGETIQDVWARSVRSWGEISGELKPEETVLVVAHDAVNKTILCDLLGLTPCRHLGRQTRQRWCHGGRHRRRSGPACSGDLPQPHLPLRKRD